MKARPLSFTAFAERVGLRLTNGQRVLARVAFDGLDPVDLDGEDRELARVIFGDVDRAPALARRTRTLTLGRNSGKTTLCAAAGVWRMVTGDVSQCGPGSVAHVITIAPTKRTAALCVRMARELVEWSPDLHRRVDAETADGFQLRRADGRLVAFATFPASRGGASARGLPALELFIDEAQFLASDSEYVVTDRDIFAAVVPRLLPGGAATLISTPWPVPTLMSELHEANFGNPTTALSARAPTLVMRDGEAQIAALVESERLRDPANAAREFDVDDSATAGTTALFDYAAIRACVDDSLVLGAEFEDDDIRTVCFGADLAFARDSSCLIGCTESEPIVVTDLLELRPSKGKPLKPSEVIATFAEVVKARGSDGFLADLHYAESAREHCEKNDIEFLEAPTGQNGKVETYLHLKKLIHEGRIVIPNHPRLIAQLRSIVSKPMPGGGISITAPRRTGLGHGDAVSGLVLAAWAVKDGEVPGWQRAMLAIEQGGGLFASTVRDERAPQLCTVHQVYERSPCVAHRRPPPEPYEAPFEHGFYVDDDGTRRVKSDQKSPQIAEYRRGGPIVYERAPSPRFRALVETTRQRNP